MKLKLTFVILVAVLAWAVRASEAQTAASAPASLRDKFQRQFVVGVALDGTLPADYSAGELGLIRGQFAALTPANCMKIDHVQREEGRFNFAMADALADFAAANQLKLCGHCLVWAKDERTPAWMFQDGDKPAGRELLQQRMSRHIAAVAGRYRGKVLSWDVVNEALDDGTNYLRPSKWVSILGEEFIAKSFALARQADPGALLIYNDYNFEIPAKRAKLTRLLRSLQESHAPIDAVGIQGHYEIDTVPYAEIEETIKIIGSFGLKVIVSELDIDLIPRARWWADGGSHRPEMSKLNPYATGCPPALLERQAEQYRKLFEIFRRHSGVVARVTFWDLHDGRSWLNHFPWERANYPLLFDRQARPKPAFFSIINDL